MNYLADLYNQEPVKKEEPATGHALDINLYDDPESTPALPTLANVPFFNDIVNVAIQPITDDRDEPAYESNFLAKPFNACEWAEEFCRIFAKQPNAQPDVGWVLGWMANAFMKGWDERCQLDTAKNMAGLMIDDLDEDEDIGLEPKAYSPGTRVYATCNIEDTEIKAGAIGFIMNSTSYDYDYCVDFGDGEELLIDAHEISACEEQAPASFYTNYKVGDKVVVNTPNSGFNGRMGVIYTVYPKEVNGYNVDVNFDDDAILAFGFHELIPMPQAIENADSAWTESTVDEIIPF